MKRLYSILSMSILALLLAGSCQKDNIFPTDPVPVSAVTDRNGGPEVCGTPLTVDLMAGQHVDAGSVIISNDAYNLYVTFQTTGPWLLKHTAVHVGPGLDCIPMTKKGTPIPGQFDYQAYHDPYLTTYMFTIPLDWATGTEIWVAAHAELVQVDMFGEIIAAETGWGGNVPGDGPRWWFYARYTIQECTNGQPGPGECSDETAWTAGSRYILKGNWAMYTPYDPDGMDPVTIWAAKTFNAGTVIFSDPDPLDDMITLTFNLTNGWTFNDVLENIKIQDYATAPVDNPNPGGFDWKSTATYFSFGPYSVQVPYNNFYGIHLDLTNCDE